MKIVPDRLQRDYYKVIPFLVSKQHQNITYKAVFQQDKPP